MLTEDGAWRSKAFGEPVAQVVEHETFNLGVEGSSPSGLTKQSKGGRYLFGRFRMTVPADQFLIGGGWQGVPSGRNESHAVWVHLDRVRDTVVRRCLPR